ncbi:MAG TPA: hemerythrin domain-containing protein [Bryobacteraceae bacterium]|nr:hemerythrin domain-containing protein [Bryobacteraceae bacterium]
MTEMNRNVMYNVAAVTGGMAIGVLGSRLLPPLIAQMSGSVRSRFGRDPFERLIKDHRKIRLLLDEMVQIPEGAPAHRAKLFLNLKRTIAKHALAEEDVVYPLLHGPVQEPQQSKHLYDEHADIKIHLYKIEQLLMANENWSGNVRSLRDLVEGHIREEEEVQFPRIRQFLDERRTRQMSGEIRREEALVL